MESVKALKTSKALYFYFFIFLLSGFSGLIYQSVWSRYLKLFLGNASYAQMVVLIIFMGGMAIGSALAARYAFKLKNLILWYGICEAIIGVFGIGFHGIFTQTISLFFDSIAPTLGSGSSLGIIKYTLAALIILPQSILLGATFPLITTGLLRKYPDESGNKISTLYFLNSFGAAIGVLCSAFVLVPAVGLPGAALTSGIINILLGLLVYALSKGDSFTVKPTKLISGSSTHTTLFLGISLITGLASFMYEIAWIRMLSMVFGASTDAFEIMLSTFILGLAIGALIIRKYVDRFTNPIKVLGLIQLAMGLLAALTIVVYNQLFDYLAFIKQTLMPTDGGYIVYNLSTFVLSALMMLPATVCAGTTLPLITHIMLKKYKSESAIGTVYAFNTIGAIIGVLLAVQVVMPSFGLKNVILIGSLFDILVGIVLIVLFTQSKMPKIALGLLGSFALVLVSSFELDKHKMASGVFRSGKLLNSSLDTKVLFHADGKVSTVAVIENQNRVRVLLNNGKPDAGVAMRKGGITLDEPTMYLLGIIPQLFSSEQSHIANIGFGSGITAETVLSNEKVKSLDTIEIEKKVVEASGLFQPKVNTVHSDLRSNIIIDDAKTIFSTQDKKYDVIISEPPNPWVSGVSSLFTVEWYKHVKKYMTSDAIFAQWLQGYEINDKLFSLIYKSLRQEFKYISVFAISGYNDFCIVASNEPLSIKQPNLYQSSGIAQKLKPLGITSFPDLHDYRLIADQQLLDFSLIGYEGINSDYFPILDHLSPKARYKNESLNLLPSLHLDRLLQELFYGKYLVDSQEPYSPSSKDLFTHGKIDTVNRLYGYITKNKTPAFSDKYDSYQHQISFKLCKEGQLDSENLNKLHSNLVNNLIKNLDFLTKDNIALYTGKLIHECSFGMSVLNQKILESILAYSQGDMSKLQNVTHELITSQNKLQGLTPERTSLLNKLSLLSAAQTRNYESLNFIEDINNKVNDQKLNAMLAFVKSQKQKNTSIAK